MPGPTSTYRLQVRPGFDLHAAADSCDHLATIGAGAVYLSPLLPSAKGSAHGYDVIGFDTVDPQRGGVDGWTRTLAAARARGLGVVVDIVPNHTGVEVPADNPAWWDLLKHGPHSRHADWFDIDWSGGRVLLPVLGDDFTPDQLEVVGDELHYFDHRFPIADGTGDGAPAEVHDRQHYELVNWRRADTEQNYRRFFAVTTLAGLRIEDPAVYEATHAEIIRWVREDGIGGLRVDHPDGLADPGRYFERLRDLLGPDRWLLIEKIVEPGERMPPEWPIDGTTGYEALNEITNVLLDGAAAEPLTALYQELTGDTKTAEEHIAIGKRTVVETILQAEVSRLARLAPGVPDVDPALRELLVDFPVYRSYLPYGTEHLDAALERARAARPDLAATFDALAPRLADPDDALARRFQQTSGAVMAKGVEDTAFYRYSRFIALNEVGGDPGRVGLTTDQWHAAQHDRQQRYPHTMTTLSTHDTKRAEDVRARMLVLGELTDEWAELARTLMSAAPGADPMFDYFLWQTFVGAGLIERERMHAYAEKAMREAATFTTWTAPDESAEAKVHALVDRAYDDPAVHGPLAAFLDRITPYGWTNGLAQKLVQLTMPGIPDVYQGTELWDDSLVDPDNRRDVDFDRRRALLDELDAASGPPPIDATGAAKLWVTSRALRLRRDWPELFGDYTPVAAQGSAAAHVLAYDRGGAITVATRLPVGLDRAGGWGDTTLALGGEVTDTISGRKFTGELAVADLLREYPVALLTR
ncbi:MAG: malto-oligosyltrehalose synthase [Jatrophihabitans sp.]|uniref:malto-oligosyltrehalose synthase n=1 Tax=Jatrophihabitans sp. TaxID=1932789 RepID=UPI003F7EAE50